MPRATTIPTESLRLCVARPLDDTDGKAERPRADRDSQPRAGRGEPARGQSSRTTRTRRPSAPGCVDGTPPPCRLTPWPGYGASNPPRIVRPAVAPPAQLPARQTGLGGHRHAHQLGPYWAHERPLERRQPHRGRAVGHGRYWREPVENSARTGLCDSPGLIWDHRRLHRRPRGTHPDASSPR